VPQLVRGSMAEADLWVLQRRESGRTAEALGLTAGKTPVWTLAREGVPLLEIYRNERAPTPQAPGSAEDVEDSVP